MNKATRQPAYPLFARILAMLLAFAMAFPMLGTPRAQAASDFNFTNDGKTLTGYTGSGGEVVIPNGVLEISEGAFKGKSNITSVTIPNSVKTIGDRAFYGCQGLTKVTIPAETIGKLAFANCSKLETVFLLYGVKSISDGAFSGCKSLTRVDVAPSVETVTGKTVFADCSNAEVYVTNKVTTGNPNAVKDYVNRLQQEETPEYTVGFTTRLPEDSLVGYDYKIKQSENGEDQIIIEGYFGDSENPVIPEVLNGGKVVEIGENAFNPTENGSTPISSVKLPESLRTIGANAFANNPNLTEVHIPANVTIGENAFEVTVILEGGDNVYEYVCENGGIIQPWPSSEAKKYHKFEIVLNYPGAGTLPNKYCNMYLNGEKIELYVVPKKLSTDQGEYRFTGWTVNANNLTQEQIAELPHLIDQPNMSQATLTMPNHDLTVTANFQFISPEIPDPCLIREDWTGDFKNATYDILATYYHGDNAKGINVLETMESGGITYSITKIGQDNYKYNNGAVFTNPEIEHIILSAKIDGIEPQAFSRATGLKSIEVLDANPTYSSPASDSSSYVAADAGILFNKNKTKLVTYPMARDGESYTVPESVTEIGDYAFYGSKNLKKIVLPAGLTSIGRYAFYGCKNLTEIVWGSVENPTTKVSEIMPYTFANCTSLTDIVLPPSSSETGVAIDSYAFAFCSNLKTVTITPAINTLASSAFYCCDNLTAYMVQEGVTKYLAEDGVLFRKNSEEKLILMAWPTAKTLPAEANGKYKVPDNVIAIDEGALGGAKISYIDLNGVKELGNAVFSNSHTLREIDLTGIEKIGHSAFFNCSALTKVTWPAGIKGYVGFNNYQENVIPFETFYFCYNLETVNMPNEITEIRDSAFYYCSSLPGLTVPTAAAEPTEPTGEETTTPTTALALPSSLKTIGQLAFYGCRSLTFPDLPGEVTSIGERAFYSCVKLTEITVPASATVFEEGAFENCTGLTKVTVACGQVPDSAFAYCSNLAQLNIDSVGGEESEIGKQAFTFCSKLERVTTKASLIDESAFEGCSALASLTLQEGVGEIRKNAFVGCDQIQTLNIPNSLTKLQERALNGCGGLEAITVSAENPVFLAQDGILYRANNTTPESYTLVVYPSRRMETVTVTPPPSTTEEGAEEGTETPAQPSTEERGVTSFTIPGSNEGELKVTKVGCYAFESPAFLTEIIFPEHVEEISYAAFYEAMNLVKIEVRSRTCKMIHESGLERKDRTVFYGLPVTTISKLIVYGYLGSTIEQEVLVNAVLKIKFQELDEATRGIVIVAVKDDNYAATSSWSGMVSGIRATLPGATAEDPAVENKLGDDGVVVVPSLVTAQTQARDGIIVLDGLTNQEITLKENETVSVKTLGKYAFHQAENELISDTTENESDVVFAGIKQIRVPATIVEISSYAVAGCNELTSFNIPSSVSKIGPYAFLDCSSLQDITIPANVTQLGKYGLLDQETKVRPYTGAFYGCSQLKEINVDSGNKNYSSINNGMLADHSQTTLLEVPNGWRPSNYSSGSVTIDIPDTVEFIQDSAFLGYVGDTSSALPVAEVKLPSKIKYIGVHAFQGVLTRNGESGEAKLTFKSRAKEDNAYVYIENEAFADCSGLVHVTLPPFETHMLNLGDDVFARCENILSFAGADYVNNPAQTIVTKDEVLYGHTTLTVDEEGVSKTYDNFAIIKYPTAKMPANMTVRVESSENFPVHQIYKSAFQGNTRLIRLELSDDVYLIDESAFEDCTNLLEVTFGKNLTSIGRAAFKNTQLSAVDIPTSVKEVHKQAFADCEALATVTVNNPTMVFGNPKGSSEETTAPKDIFAILNAQGNVQETKLIGHKDSTAQTYVASLENVLLGRTVSFETMSHKVSTTIDPADAATIAFTVDEKSATPAEDGSLMVHEGSTVKFTVTPTDGYAIAENGITINKKSGSETSNFEMPTTDVAIEVKLSKIPTFGIEVFTEESENLQIEFTIDGKTAADMSKMTAKEGVAVTFEIVTPGYYTVTLGETPLTAENGVYQFTMPNENVEIHIQKIPEYTISVEETEATVSDITVDSQSKDALNGLKAVKGAVVTFKATAKDNYLITNVTVNGDIVTSDNGVYTFTMPEADVTIKVEMATKEEGDTNTPAPVDVGDIEVTAPTENEKPSEL